MIRIATADDAAEILKIYRPAIEQSAVSFETAVPSLEEMRQRIESCLEHYPWIVEEEQGVLRGYAYASRYHTRAAYRWAAIVSVYIDTECLRQGIASSLYDALFPLLEQLNIRQLLAAISVPNAASQEFHEALGFRQVGIIPKVGYKLGQWQSTGWWQRSLGEGAESEPKELIPFQMIAAELNRDLSTM